MPRFLSRLAALACALALVAPSAALARDRDLEARADRLAADTGFDGVMLVGDGHRVRMAKAYGMEDAERGLRASTATRYQTGSFSKWLASVVVLRLVDQGRLSLTAPVSTYLPEYAPANGARVTLHHLMSHTSGVPNDLAAALKASGTMAAFAGVDARTALQRYASSPLAFAPGERFDYSHSNWLVVQAVVERVTGKPYAQLARELVLRPLRLRDSDVLQGDFYDVPHAARGYDALHPVPKPSSTAMLAPVPAFLGQVGGMYATAGDVQRLLDGVYSGRLLSPASREALWRVNVPEQDYAYGGRVRTRRIDGHEHRMSWNNNSNGPYKSLIVRADDGRTVVLLNNSRIDGAALTRIAESLLGVAPADG
ncbi:serine hydrolase domain-containing protein [Cognatilysobacter segetis]|uniref:serine hydrolase domain-containing protein n=1 Tax=Cognatilysobacter segetis TaxID=2492394 RepID=UPI00138FBA3D|nr:serine hydrolase domain-containing protein [Lysobacter segetis]